MSIAPFAPKIFEWFERRPQDTDCPCEWPAGFLYFAVVANFNRQTALPARIIEAIAERVAGIQPRPAVSLASERDATAEARAALVGRYGQGVPSSEYFEQDGKLAMRLAGTVLPVRLSADGTRVIVRPANGPTRVTTVVRDSTGAVVFLVRDGKAYRKH